MSTFITWLDTENNCETSDVGPKAANLVKLRRHSITVPVAFCVRASAFDQHLAQNGLKKRLKMLFERVDLTQPSIRRTISAKAQALVLQGDMSPELLLEISKAHRRLASGKKIPLVVR